MTYHVMQSVGWPAWAHVQAKLIKGNFEVMHPCDFQLEKLKILNRFCALKIWLILESETIDLCYNFHVTKTEVCAPLSLMAKNETSWELYVLLHLYHLSGSALLSDNVFLINSAFYSFLSAQHIFLEASLVLCHFLICLQTIYFWGF